MDALVLRYIIEITCYLIALIFSGYVIGSLALEKFIHPHHEKVLWLLYIILTLAVTYGVGSLIIKFIGIDFWLQ